MAAAPRPADRQGIRDQALRWLTRREHTTRELAMKFRARGYDSDSVVAALVELTEQGLQSDQRFAEAFARTRAESGYGPLRIRSQLRERGVDDDTIRAALSALSVDWFEACAAAWRKAFGATPDTDIKARAKQQRFLSYRGFDPADIRQLLRD